MPEGHLVSAPPLCQPCCTPQGQAESGGMVLVAYAGPVRPAAALRDSVLCLPTDIHSLLVNKPSSSSSSSPSLSPSFSLSPLLPLSRHLSHTNMPALLCGPLSLLRILLITVLFHCGLLDWGTRSGLLKHE